MYTFLLALNMRNQGRGQAAFVPYSHRGLAKPWIEVPMHLNPGDAWVGDSRTAHYGGGWASMGPGTPRYRYALFVSYQTRRWDYTTQVPYWHIPPPFGEPFPHLPVANVPLTLMPPSPCGVWP